MPAYYYPPTSDGMWSWNSTATTSSTTSIWFNQTAATTATGSTYVYWTTSPNVTAPTIVRSPTIWWNTQPAPTVYREPIHRPAVIHRRPLVEHAREVVRDVTQRRETGDVNRRALRLLMSHLTPVQRQTFIENGWFVVEGGRSRQRYRIRGKNVMANIDVLDGERVAHRLCGHCDHSIPISDQLLAQKIMLEIAEDDFLKLANRHAA